VTPQTAFVVQKFARDLGVDIPNVNVYANKLTIAPPRESGTAPRTET
jgi:hypothetical protein